VWCQGGLSAFAASNDAHQACGCRDLVRCVSCAGWPGCCVALSYLVNVVGRVFLCMCS
jgi:hypothetical protein